MSTLDIIEIVIGCIIVAPLIIAFILAALAIVVHFIIEVTEDILL